MLEMKNISKVYRTDLVETHALRDFTLRVDDGEFVAVTGPSGSGKTTFLNIAGMLETFSSGEYSLDGENVSGLNDNQRSRIRNQKIGFIFQSFNLIPDLDLFDKDARRDRRHRNPTGLGAARPIEHGRVVAGAEDLRETRQRRTDDIDTTHELVRTAVDVNTSHDNRQNLERLRTTAPGRRETASDILEDEAEFLILLLALLDQHLA